MKFKNILLIIFGIFLLAGIFIYVEPSITGYVIQERFLISDIKVSAEGFEQEVKVEQFDEHEIKLDNALYYFIIEPEYEQEINYVLIEFMVDSSQIRGYDKDSVSLYLFNEKWLELDVEFVKQDGRFLYYKSKSKEFGLFAAGVKEKEEIVKPFVNKNDLLLFALIPIFIIVLLFSVLSYGFVRIVQRINYRFYLFFRKVLFGLIKFGLSFGIVVMVLDLISPEYGGGEVNLIYYAVIPVLILTLLSNIILNLILHVHKLVVYNKAYKFFRNFVWLFVLSFIGVISLLFKYAPKVQGELTRSEVVIYGLMPVVMIAFSFVFVLYLFYVLTRKAVRV